MANIYDFEIGADVLTMVNVETLDGGSMPAPRAPYKVYTEPIELGSGAIRGAGFPSVIWRWGFLTQEQRDALRTYCPGASANVYIKTSGVDSADAYGIYSAVMVWPEEEDRQASRRTDFAIEFRRLVPQT